MLKKEENVPNGCPVAEGGLLIRESQIRYLTGRLLTIVESLGFRESQEKALKDIISQEINKNLFEPYYWIGGDWVEKINSSRESVPNR